MAKFELPWWRQSKAGIFESYLSEKRTLNYLEKAYGKIAFGSAGGYDTIWGKNNIPATITQNQFDVDDTTSGKGKKKTVTSEPIYTKVTGDKFRPKDHLISIYTGGISPNDMGTIRKGRYTYRTYGGLGNLPKIEDVKTMSWGWAYGGKVLSSESFTGNVVGYNIQSNSEGGFDVTIELIEKTSVSIAGFNVNQPMNANVSTGTDGAGNQYVASDPLSAIAMCQVLAAGSVAKSGPTTFGKIKGLITEIPENYDKPDPITSTTTSNPANASSRKAYVTFQSIIDLINEWLPKTSQILFPGIEYDSAPFDPGTYAANPLQILIPPNTVYGDRDFNAGGMASPIENGKLRLPNILIAVDTISEIATATRTDSNTAGGTERSLSIKSFLDNILKVINDNLGSPYSFTFSNSTDTSDLNLYIVEFNCILRGISPQTIGTVRSANLTANLDSEAQKFFLVKTRYGASIKDNIAVEPDNLPNDPIPYNTAVRAVGVKAESTNVNALKALNINKTSRANDGASDFATYTPWNLSLTIDGVAGWQYGYVISYSPISVQSLLPSGYKIGFAVLDIEHNVQDGDWVINLSTGARVYK